MCSCSLLDNKMFLDFELLVEQDKKFEDVILSSWRLLSAYLTIFWQIVDEMNNWLIGEKTLD